MASPQKPSIYISGGKEGFVPNSQMGINVDFPRTLREIKGGKGLLTKGPVGITVSPELRGTVSSLTSQSFGKKTEGPYYFTSSKRQPN